MDTPSDEEPAVPTNGWFRSRRAVIALLIAHGIIVWGAFLLRVDRFPLSWAPMYTVLRPKPILPVAVWDRSAELVATRRDGTTERLDAKALNIPTLSFWRLYYERMIGRAPAHHYHERVHEDWNQGLRHALSIEDFPEFEWERLVLESVNGTLDRRADDPDFIVSLEAPAEHILFDSTRPGWFDREQVAPAYRWNDAGSTGRRER